MIVRGSVGKGDERPLVMHVLYSFDVGGLENGVVNLINHMAYDRFRHAVVAIAQCAPSFCQRVRRTDVEFISLHKPPGHGVKLYPRLYRLFRQTRPAIVHTRNLAALEFAVPAAFAGVRARVHGEHGWDTSDPGGTRRKYQLLRRAYSPFVNRYVALSGQIESYLTDRVGIARGRVERICNGVDTQRFRPAVQRASIAGSPFADPAAVVIGTVGRLQTVKDQVSLVRAVAIARKQGVDGSALRLLIAGDGPQRAEVESEIRAAGIADITWLAGERSDVPEVMRAIDVFALPSRPRVSPTPSSRPWPAACRWSPPTLAAMPSSSLRGKPGRSYPQKIPMPWHRPYCATLPMLHCGKNTAPADGSASSKISASTTWSRATRNSTNPCCARRAPDNKDSRLCAASPASSTPAASATSTAR